MKKIVSLLIIVSLALGLTLAGCKKDEPKKQEDVTLSTKSAKYRLAVYKDLEMKTWLATLSKTENVDLLGISQGMVKNKKAEIARVRLSTGEVGYTPLSALADKAIVFVADTKAYVRNNMSSGTALVIPRGSVGFAIAEKGEWVQIYMGKINGKWITTQWVKDGFSSEESLIQEGVLFEKYSTILKNNNTSSAQNIEKAAKRMKEMADTSTSFFKELALKMLQEDGEDSEEDADEGAAAPAEEAEKEAPASEK